MTELSRAEKMQKIEETAVEVAKLLGKLEEMANDASFGMEVSGGYLTFNDWQSSDCYGEGNSDTFGVNEDGSVWYTSSC